MIDKRLREIKAKRKRQWGDGAREIQREKQRAGDVAQWQSACLAVQGPRLEPQPLHTHTMKGDRGSGEGYPKEGQAARWQDAISKTQSDTQTGEG
jgi:hypothetical protein